MRSGWEGDSPKLLVRELYRPVVVSVIKIPHLVAWKKKHGHDSE